MFRGFGIYFEIGNPSFDSAHTFLCDKMKHREWYVDPSCQLHIEQFDTWGAKRYQKGNLEGTLRDQLEVEGNDTCINHVYAYNANLKYLDALWEEQADAAYTHPRAEQKFTAVRESMDMDSMDEKWDVYPILANIFVKWDGNQN
jgi:hypothetical protein